MTINVLGSDYTISATNIATLSYSCHAGSNRRLFAWATQEGSGTQSVTAFTYAGIALTPLIENETGGMLTSIYCLLDADFPSVAPHVLSVTSSYYGRLVLGVLEVENVKQDSVFDTAPDYNASASILSEPISVPTGNAIVLLVGAGDLSSSSLTENTSTALYESLVSGSSMHCAGYSIEAFAGGIEGLSVLASPAMEVSLAAVCVEEGGAASRSFFIGGSGF